jgi:hypothetical protein
MFIACLTDAAEFRDSTCSPYGHSLLYLVSRAFEQENNAPVVGMEKFLVPTIAARKWGSQVVRLTSPGGTFAPGGASTTAITHGGMDDDVVVQDSVIRHIKNDVKATVLR